jgi:hypothetical protein
MQSRIKAQSLIRSKGHLDLEQKYFIEGGMYKNLLQSENWKLNSTFKKSDVQNPSGRYLELSSIKPQCKKKKRKKKILSIINTLNCNFLQKLVSTDGICGCVGYCAWEWTMWADTLPTLPTSTCLVADDKCLGRRMGDGLILVMKLCPG